jgi:hypothetical protein
VSDTVNLPDSRREELRRRWLSHAAAAFDLMFDPIYQDQLQSFEQREQHAHQLSRDLAAWILAQHANADEQAALPEGQLARCPRWGKPAQLDSLPDDPLPQRALTSSAGEVTLKRQRWRCTTCRVAFSPSGPPTRSGGRRL